MTTTVLIDGFALADGSQLRGIGTYLKRLLAGLGELPEVEVTLLADERVRVPSGAARIALRRHAPARLRDLEHDLALPGAIRRQRPNVFHSPAQHPPRRSVVPWVQTLHDVIPLTHPHPLLASDRRRWLRLGPRLRGAAAVIAVSRFSADEGIRHFGLDPQVMHVIHLGVDRAVFHPAPRTPDRNPYLLHVAAWGPHKGFGEALGVIARIAERGLPHRLVLAGAQDPWMMTQLRAAVASAPRPDLVDVAGYVEDLPATYRGASALLMTSRCEGFGLPALEAMACGTPVIAFANSSLPEVVGEGGVLVADGNVDAMADAAGRLLGDDREHAELAERGLAHASRFRWEDTVAGYAELFHAVAR